MGGRWIYHKHFKSLGELTKEMFLKVVILPNIEISDKGCWLWKKGVNGKGYASITLCGKKYLVHRLVLTFKNFKEPDQTDHRCRNKTCLNEDHLEDVTYSINNLRMWANKRKDS